jgi:endonuclease/exonuclease/phosphatase family metal-dependent hydrolase
MTHVILVLLSVLPLFLPHGTLVLKNSAPRTEPRQKHLPLKDELSLLESGRATKLRQNVSKSNEIKVLSYNIRWRSGDELKKLIKLFQDDPEIGNASILGLQEVDRQKKRSGRTNTVKEIAEGLGLHYAWAAPPTAKAEDEEETGVAILSIYPISDIRRIVLPHEGPGKRRRVAIGATLRITKVTDVRVYSAHAETRISLDKKLQQMDALLQDLGQYPSSMPAIVLGDLNTWKPSAKRKASKLFIDAGLQTPFGSQSTFSRRILFVPIELRLDWVWLRNLEVAGYGINRKISISDHWPLWVNLKLPPEKH